MCREACSDALVPHEHAECLLHFRFASDPEALAVARRIYQTTGALVGVNEPEVIAGFHGERVELFPALPIGEHRHHLEWLDASLRTFDAFVEAVSSRAVKPVSFDPRPLAFVFFRTATPGYPSAYAWHGIIGYNVDGPLNTSSRSAHETLFHELFHFNDARREIWSKNALSELFDAIVLRCNGDHECLEPFAPHETLVRGGTFYAFDRRTRDVSEYAAELALRYFLEHEAILAGEPPMQPPFKCRTVENGEAWHRLVEEFFGGADLTPNCEGG